MSQVLQKDKIINLAHSAGNITLGAGSVLTIGGKQFALASQLSVALPSMIANSLYFVYAIVSGGVPALAISQNVNSVGPSGQPAWKLIGALYSNGASPIAFGSFVNIEGTPESNWVSGELVTVTGASSNPTKGSTTFDSISWKRSGESLVFKVLYKQTSGGTTGSGAYRYHLPASMSANTSKISTGLGLLAAKALVNGATGLADGYARIASGFSDRLEIIGGNDVLDHLVQSDTRNSFGSTNLDVSIDGELPISGWDNRSLKDL